MSVSGKLNMATAAPTPSLGAVYTAPTHVPPSLWIFPPALDWEFVSKFNARLPLSSERRADETGTFRLLPPSPYSDNYQLPDVIVDALDNLTLPQLVGAPDVGASRQFGMGMSEPVESGHVIKLNWEGDEEKIVRMTCHICAAAGKDKDQTKTKCRSRMVSKSLWQFCDSNTDSDLQCRGPPTRPSSQCRASSPETKRLWLINSRTRLLGTWTTTGPIRRLTSNSDHQH